MTPRFTAPQAAHHRAASRRDSPLPRPPAVPGDAGPQGCQLPRPPRTRPWRGFCAVAVTLFAMMLSATLPTALYATYAHRFGFGPGTLTLIFAAYVAGIRAVLVLLGDLADRIGYRTVLLAAVIIAVLGSALLAAAGCGSDKCCGRGVVEARGRPLARGWSRAIASSAKQWFFAAGQFQVMAEVGGGLGEVHRLDGEPGGYPLVQGSERAQAQLPVQGGLADEDPALNSNCAAQCVTRSSDE
jgi:hypothetical protein